MKQSISNGVTLLRIILEYRQLFAIAGTAVAEGIYHIQSFGALLAHRN